MPKGIAIYGKKVAERRRKEYLTQAKVASLVEMSIENVKRIEKREVAHILAAKFPKLAAALGMPLADAERMLRVQQPSKIEPTLPLSSGVEPGVTARREGQETVVIRQKGEPQARVTQR